MNNLWSMELELKALKTILTPNQEWGQKLYSACRAEHFHHKVGKAIYKRLSELCSDGEVELPSYEFLLRDSKIPDGVRETAFEAFRETPTVESQGDFDYLLKELTRLARTRQLYKGTSEIANKIIDENSPEIDLKQMADSLGAAIMSVDDRDRSVSLIIGKGYSQSAEDAYQAVINGVFAKNLVKSGFAEFDSRTGGFSRGNLVIIGANSGGGKSTLAINLLVRQYRLGYDVCLVSFEMTEKEVLCRLLSCISEVDMNKLYAGKMSPEEKQRVEVAYREFILVGVDKGNNYNVIHPNGSATISEIGFLIRPLKLDTVIIDYINFVSATGKEEQQWKAMETIAEDSKLLANKLSCVVMLLVQLKDTYELKYSQGIKNPADFVFGFVMDEQAKQERIIEVHTIKARNASVYNWSLKERYDIMQLRDPDQEDRRIWPDEREYWAILDRLNDLKLLKESTNVVAANEKTAPKKTVEPVKQDDEPVKQSEPQYVEETVRPELSLRDDAVIPRKVRKKAATNLMWSSKDIVPVDITKLDLKSDKAKSFKSNDRNYEDTL